MAASILHPRFVPLSSSLQWTCQRSTRNTPHLSQLALRKPLHDSSAFHTSRHILLTRIVPRPTTFSNPPSQSLPLLFRSSPFQKLSIRGIRSNWYDDAKRSWDSSSSNSKSSWSRPNNFKRWLNNLDERQVIWGLIGTNVVVFLAWQFAQSVASQRGELKYLRFMSKNFVVSWDRVRDGKIWTIFTSMFSHNNLLHLGINMFVLHSFGSGIIALLGTAPFLSLYLLSGLTGSLFSIAHAYFNRPRQHPLFPQRAPTGGAVGASAAIAGPMVLYTFLYPKAQVLLFMVIPVPAWAAIGSFFAWDLWRSLKGPTGTTDSAGHIGGAVAGIAYWWFRFRKGRGRW